MTAKKVDETNQDALLDGIARDHGGCDLTQADHAMLDYAEKLTLTPREISAADVDSLRAAGFDDRGVHDICSITAYFAYVNRIADGLGVDLEGAQV